MKFKNVVSILASAALAVSAIPTISFAAETEDNSINSKFSSGELPTDANMDGKFDLNDARSILLYYATVMASPDQSYTNSDDISEEVFNNIRDNFDYDNNGKVNSNDASLLLNYYYSNSIKGDVDMNGSVNSIDATLILRYYADALTETEVPYETEMNMKYLGDLNNDGKINSIDASLVLYGYAESMVK